MGGCHHETATCAPFRNEPIEQWFSKEKLPVKTVPHNAVTHVERRLGECSQVLSKEGAGFMVGSGLRTVGSDAGDQCKNDHEARILPDPYLLC